MNSRNWLVLATLPIALVIGTPFTRSFQTKPTTAKAYQDPLGGTADIQDVLSLISERYVVEPDNENVIAGGIQTLLEKTHPMNSLLSPMELTAADPGEAEVGLYLIKRGIYATVMAVRPLSPAAEAGFQPGDTIRRINGSSVSNVTTWSINQMLRGLEGSSIELQRYSLDAGTEIKTTLMRKAMKVQSLETFASPEAILLSLPDFGSGRFEQVREALQNISRSQAIIFDLRNNIEGDLSTAEKIANLFVRNASFGSLEVKNEPIKKLSLPDQSKVIPNRIIIIQDISTIGVAEVFVSCLKSQGKALVLGRKTTGLAVVMKRVPLQSGGAVELVVGGYLGAGGEKLAHLQGVIPTQNKIPVGSKQELITSVMTSLN